MRRYSIFLITVYNHEISTWASSASYEYHKLTFFKPTLVCPISPAIVRDLIIPEWNKISPDADIKSGANRVLKTGQKAAETGNVMEILRNLDILRDWVKPGKPFHNTEDFPFCKILEENYEVIRKEFEALAQEHLVAWPERYLCKKGWDVFGLYAFNNRLEENCAKCPETARILASIPGMTTAMFSCLQPRTHIRPHIGYFQYSNYILRAHLGIRVPLGCALKVNGVEQTWENGKTFVFDDTFRHEAYNKSDELRVVLMIDFKYEGDPSERNPAFQEQSPTIPGGADDALVSPALMAKLSEFVQPSNCRPQNSPTTSDS
jgi:beta-hydroxylase